MLVSVLVRSGKLRWIARPGHAGNQARRCTVDVPRGIGVQVLLQENPLVGRVTGLKCSVGSISQFRLRGPIAPDTRIDTRMKTRVATAPEIHRERVEWGSSAGKRAARTTIVCSARHGVRHSRVWLQRFGRSRNTLGEPIFLDRRAPAGRGRGGTISKDRGKLPSFHPMPRNISHRRNDSDIGIGSALPDVEHFGHPACDRPRNQLLAKAIHVTARCR